MKLEVWRHSWFSISGVKSFKLADPIHNHNLFILAEKEIKEVKGKKKM